MAETFQFGAQREVVVNLPVKDDSTVAIFGKDGLIAMVQVDDFPARRAQREERRLKHALLVGTAVNQCGRGLPDSFRRRAPVFSGKPGDSAQLPAPSLSREALARCDLRFEKNSPIAVYLVYQSDRNRRPPQVLMHARAVLMLGWPWNQCVIGARECTRTLAPFHMICTPMQTRRKEHSRSTMLMPLSPITAARRSAKP